MTDKPKKLYVDMPIWGRGIKVDDFLIAIGVKQSNSVYHVFEVNPKDHPKLKRVIRYHIKVFKSDLITALSRDPEQYIIPLTWYKREKKQQL